MRTVRHLTLFALFWLMVSHATLGQVSRPLTDVDYWNQPYGFNYNIGASTPIVIVDEGYHGGYDDSLFDFCSSQISRCFQGQGAFHLLLNTPIDTNLESLLIKSVEVLVAQDVISKDYSGFGDVAYNTFLADVYRLSVSATKQDREYLAKKAKTSFDKIQNGTISKSIAFLQLSYWDKDLDELSSGEMYNDLQRFQIWEYLNKNVRVSLSYSSTSDNKGESLLYECIGDYWARYGYIGKGTAYYHHAIGQLNGHKLEDAIQIQRLREKTLDLIKLDNSKAKIFNNIGADIMRDMLSANAVGEFNLHNKIVVNEFSNAYDNSPSNDNLKSDLALLLKGQSKSDLKIDVADLLYAFCRMAAIRHDYEARRRCFIILLNYISENRLIRYRERMSIINDLFHLYLENRQYNDARLISRAFLNYSTKKGDYAYLKYFTEESEIWLSKGNLDSATIELNRSNDFSMHLHDYAYLFDIYKSKRFITEQIALKTKNIDLYKKLENQQTSLVSSRENEYSEAQKEILDQDRTTVDNRLRRNIYILIGLILFTLLVFGLVIGILVYRRRSNDLMISREKIALELESFKASYFDHAVGDKFKYIISKVEIGRYNNKTSFLESAVRISQKLEQLFDRIREEFKVEATLLSELKANEEYVALVSECIDKRITWLCDIDPEFASGIKVPTNAFSDFYINAIKHGNLAAIEGAFIRTTLQISDSSDCYILSITNNGEGIAQAEERRKPGHESTGHKRATRRFEIYNLQKPGASILFKTEKDFSELKNPDGVVIGTQVRITIIRRNDKG